MSACTPVLPARHLRGSLGRWGMKRSRRIAAQPPTQDAGTCMHTTHARARVYMGVHLIPPPAFALNRGTSRPAKCSTRTFAMADDAPPAYECLARLGRLRRSKRKKIYFGCVAISCIDKVYYTMIGLTATSVQCPSRTFLVKVPRVYIGLILLQVVLPQPNQLWVSG